MVYEIIRVWPLFFSSRLHFLPILLVKLDFLLSVFWFFVFLYLWILVFSFFVLCFEFNVVLKDFIIFVSSESIINHVLLNFVLTLYKRFVKRPLYLSL